MRFWITKNSELPVHEQLVRQVMLGILSEDLPAGHKLPSIRALARRHRIHSNTVSAAYHELLDRGWLELRRGSGLYVKALPADTNGDELGALLKALLRAASEKGHQPQDVLRRLLEMVAPRSFSKILVAEPETGMREILQMEIQDQLGTPVVAVEPVALATLPDVKSYLVAALTTRAPSVGRLLPEGLSCIALRLRSVRKSMESEQAPPPNMIIWVASRSAEFRKLARAMLIAAGLDPDCVCDIDAAARGWKARLSPGAVVVSDLATARNLPAGCIPKLFRVIADSSIAKLQQLCGSE